MSVRTRALIITLLLGSPAFLLGPVFWPLAPDVGVPTSGQLPFFVTLAVIEAALFGLAVAFIVLAWPYVQQVGAPYRTRARLAYASLAWLLISWWPHDNLHIHNGMNLQGLLYIEYGFHVTLIVASLALAYVFIQTLREAYARTWPSL